MGLRRVMDKAAGAAMKAVGNVPASANYMSVSSTTTYDASSGTTTLSTTDVNGIKAIITGFKVAEIDGERIRTEDRTAVVVGASISTVAPKVQDRMKIDGSTFYVIDFQTDPAEAIWKFHIRPGEP